MTVFSYLALALSSLSSTGMSTLGTIIASAAWVVGSVIIPGNVFLLPDANTTTTSKVYVGAQETLNITASGLGFITNGSQTGVTLKDGTTTVLWSRTLACTATGGLAKYPTCYVPNPFGSTGALVNVSHECGNVGTNLTMSGGFVTSTTTAVSSAFPTMNDFTAGTGSFVAFNVRATSGSVLEWKPGEAIKFQTITTLPSTSDCAVHVEAYDKYGR